MKISLAAFSVWSPAVPLILYINTCISFSTVWMETQQQTNGDAIMVGGQKPKLDNGIDKDWIA